MRRLDPVLAERDRESSREWKRRNKERTRQYDRDYHQRMKKPCPECGEPMNRGGVGPCLDCIRRAAERRRQDIVEMYEAGVPLTEIAEVIGTTRNAIGVDLDRLRRAGRIGRRYPLRASI
jgi:DNA-directed RNA polymerase specialized sigma24 family protein